MKKFVTIHAAIRWLAVWMSFCYSLWGLRAQPLSDFSDEVYLDGWDQMVGMTYDANGLMYVWEKGGTVYVVEDSVRQPDALFDISEEVGSWGAHGMLGFALDPEYLTNGYIYALYAVDRHHLLYYGTPSYSPTADLINDATIGRLTRYTVINPGDPANAYVDYTTRNVLVGASIDDGFPITANTHGVGGLLFGTDGTLLASCGDGAFPSGYDFGSLPESWYQQALADGILNDTTNCGAYRSQSMHSLSGKLLRIDPATGAGLASNPYYDPADPYSVGSRVWALGLRQPFRMTLMPGTGGHYPSDGDPGVIVIGDVGSGNREELDICDQPGLNFGWPLYEGMGTMSSYYNQAEPNLAAPAPAGCGQAFYTYQDLIYHGSGTPTWPDPCGSGDISSTYPRMVHEQPRMDYRGDAPRALHDGGTYDIGTPEFSGSYFDGSCILSGFLYQGTDFPENYQNSFFFGDYADGWIKRLTFTSEYDVDSVYDFIDIPSTGTIVGLYTSPFDGGLYYLNFENEIRKVRFVGNNNRRPTAVIEQDLIYSANSSATVQFDATNSTDVESAPLSYLWDFGDGVLDSSATPSHLFAAPSSAPETYDVTLTVTDTGGLSHTVHSTVWLNNTPPQLLSTSIDSVDFYAMDVPTLLDLTAEVVDAEHPHDSLTFIWQAFLYHDTHNHPEPKVLNDTAFFEIVPIGCVDYAVYWYVIEFTVIDPEGLTTRFSKEIHPNCDLPVAFADDGSYIRGQAAALDVLDNDLIYDGVDLATIAVVDPPAHGSATADPATGLITYQHDGTLTDVDSFTYQIADVDGTTSAPGVVRLSRAPSPTIDLLTPVDGTVAEDDRETTTYSLGGNVEAIHGILFKANGNVIGHDSLLRGFYRLTDIPPGNYQLQASLLDAAGQEFGIPESQDSASVTYVALGSSFAHAMDITIHASEVEGTTPHTDFPFFFTHTAPELRHSSAGGDVQHPEGRDIAFRLSNGTTLDHEIERYDPSTGELVAWVRMPSLSPTTDTELEMIYGSTGYDRVLSTPYTWGDTYVGRWHMNPNLGATPEMYDGTANDHDGTTFGAMTSANVISGIAGDGVFFDGSDDFMDVGGFATPGDRFTLSAWIQGDPANTGNHGVVGYEGLGACCGSRAPSIMVRQASRLRAGFSDGSGFNFLTTPYNVVDASGSTWNYLTMTYDGTNLRVMVDGVTVSNNTSYAGSSVATSPVRHIGRMDNNFFRGNVDEVSVSSVAHSEDYTRTEYHNLIDPATFFSVTPGTPPSNEQPLIDLSTTEELAYVQAVGSPSLSRTLAIANVGTGTLYDVSIEVPGFADFVATPNTLDSLPAGQSTTVALHFAPSSAGPQFGTLTVSSADSTVGSRTLPVKGLGQSGPSSLQWLVDYHFGSNALDVGDDDAATPVIHSDGTLQGQVQLGAAWEARHFRRADASLPATFELLAAGPSGPDTVAVVGWTDPYVAGSFTEVYATDSVQDLGSTSFTPAADSFGLATRWPGLGQRMVYSDDTLNTFAGANPHHIRAYPLPGESDAWLLAIEAEANSFTFQDLVLIGRNLDPVLFTLPTDTATQDTTPADSTPGDSTITPPEDSLVGGTVLYRVDAGGTGRDSIDDGPSWARDTRWEPTVYLASDPAGHRAANSIKSSYDVSVDVTSVPADLFYYHRWDRGSGGNMEYAFPVANGTYELRLYLAEGEADYLPGDRVFSVQVEGQVPPIYTDIDLVAEYGNLVGAMKAYVVSVTDGSLDLEFLHGVAGTPIVNGIEVIAEADSSSGSTPPQGEAEMTFSTREVRVLEAVGATNTDYQVVITNTGTDTLEHTDIVVAGPDADQFTCTPVHFHYVPAGDSIVVDLTYTPMQAGAAMAWLEVGPHDTTVAREIVDLYGFAYQGEPSLALLAEYWYGAGMLDVGDDDLATTLIHSDSATQVAPLLGEEVTAQVFAPADSTLPVTVEWRALHGVGSVVDTAVVLAWHDWDAPSQAEAVGWVSGPQSGVDLTAAGASSFTPGSDPFALRSRWLGIGNRSVSSIDSLNAFAAAGSMHHVRSYPVPGESDAYLMAVQARTQAYEYQDLVLVLRNVAPATVVVPTDSTPPGDSNAVVIYRIDAGGTGQPAVDGGLDWESDTRWAPTPYLSSDPADSRSYSYTIANFNASVDVSTTNLDIFYYERWDRSGGDDIMYAFPVSAGYYEVHLFVSNTFSGGTTPGQRMFSIEVEGSLPPHLVDVDPTALFGNETGGMLSHTVYVGDGNLDIRLLRNLDNPSVNGIEVLQLNGIAARRAQAQTQAEPTTVPSVLLYPNPTRKDRQVLVQVTLAEKQMLSYALYDAQGRPVDKETQVLEEGTGHFKLDARGLATGIYLLRVSGNGWQEIRRLVVR